MIFVSPHCSINEDELSFSFVRSGGPGGQNVNKVSTAAQLRFDVSASPNLSAEVKKRLVKLAGSRINNDGILHISASRFRTQERNKADAVDRLVMLIRKALVEPKKRKKTRPTFASKGKRVEKKRRHGEKKRNRGAGNWEMEI
ncbi:MAG TPA: alternative ribosome rescue aminoacyl-tRNA hydrolase ArfB [Chitinivibrionales bacterium]|nr:alternative ribosome rescue aminoacyl-tRNA hydrolase ArfB [Chitinivibrionales bacterium]